MRPRHAVTPSAYSPRVTVVEPQEALPVFAQDKSLIERVIDLALGYPRTTIFMFCAGLLAAQALTI